MFVKIRRSPNPRKKFRVILEDGRTVDFGARGYSDYTKHRVPHVCVYMSLDMVARCQNPQ